MGQTIVTSQLMAEFRVDQSLWTLPHKRLSLSQHHTAVQSNVSSMWGSLLKCNGTHWLFNVAWDLLFKTVLFFWFFFFCVFLAWAGNEPGTSDRRGRGSPPSATSRLYFGHLGIHSSVLQLVSFLLPSGTSLFPLHHDQSLHCIPACHHAHVKPEEDRLSISRNRCPALKSHMFCWQIRLAIFT